MVNNDRQTRSKSFRVESLETRNLLSLIGSKPTIDAIEGPGVHHKAFGRINITQPAVIQVFGTAQPGAPGTAVSVSVYAEDSEGNLVNGGVPLATTTPDLLGRYHALVSLPSRLRADINYLVARETASAVETSSLAINGTTINNLAGTLNINAGTLTGLTGTIANPANTITGLGGTLTVPATPITDIGGSLTIPAFPITTPIGAGAGGPAVGTLLGGTGTLGAQVGTLAGGAGTLATTTSTLTQTGPATISATTGTFSNGTGNIAPTTGTETQLVNEVAVSDPLAVLIHQPRNVGVFFPTNFHARPAKHAASASLAHYQAVHTFRHK